MSANIWDALPCQVKLDLTRKGSWRIDFIGRSGTTIGIFIQNSTEENHVGRPGRSQLNLWDQTGNITRGDQRCTKDLAWHELKDTGKTDFYVNNERDLFDWVDYGRSMESLYRWIELTGFRSIIGDQIHDAEILRPFEEHSHQSA